MKRRDLISLLAGTAAGWPLRARAQEPTRTYRLGLLSGGAPIGEKSPLGGALARGLARFGYTLGRNLAFEPRGAETHIDRLPQLVADLVASKADVIVASGYPAALAAKKG